MSRRHWIAALRMFPALVWTCSLCPARAQNSDHRTIRLSLPDRTIEAQVLNEHKHVDPKEDREYHWCIGQRIMATQGGADGDLLDGTYREFHPNGQLRAKGELSKGLKRGVWYEWNAQGRLVAKEKWRHGRRHGKRIVYDSGGGEPATSEYSKGKEVERKQRPGKNAAETSGTEEDLRKKDAAKETKENGVAKRKRKRGEQDKDTDRSGKKEKDKARPEETKP